MKTKTRNISIINEPNYNTLLEKWLTHLNTITASKIGITRLAFTDTDWEARAYIKQIMKDLNLEIREDSFGNIFGRYTPINVGENNPAILIGSHIDSVPQGGNYDGVVGVLTGLATIKYFKDLEYNSIKNNKSDSNFLNLKYPLEVVVFSNEEGSRFGAATLGSRAIIGELANRELDNLIDKDGISLRTALLNRNLKPNDIDTGNILYKKPPIAFLEVHIEQGKVLEEKNINLGIVTGIAAPARFKVIITGSADHSGATPMHMRHDALCAASELILALEKYANKVSNAGEPVVGTIGVIKATPGAMNVIPGEVELGIDIRSISEVSRTKVVSHVKSELNSICKKRNITYSINEITAETPVALSDNIIQILAKACENLKYEYIKMPSGAGHDAMNMAKLTPTGMLFIPCKNGISHNALESAKISDITEAISVIIETINLL